MNGATRAPENMKIYLDIATALLSQDPPPRLEARRRDAHRPGRCRAALRRRRPGAWLVLLQHRPDPRRRGDWFRTALGWKADDEPSAYGLALSTQRLNDRAAFNAVVAQWRSRSQRIADLADGP